ncbi:FMN-binding glutamate synthase family protein [Tepidibacillus infernus]|nr:FMN-binding glutamate synthase family protein [Tepidibacillus decaturensis]
MFEYIFNKILNSMTDEMIHKIMTEPYDNNLLEGLTVTQRLGIRSIIEAGIRAQSGQSITRPLGSPINHSHWDLLYLNSTQLFQLPTMEGVPIDTSVTIGPRAKKPLHLSIPIMITGMSYGGSLSLNAKVALAKGATMAGTSTNTGESAVSDEERSAAALLIGQLNRGHFMMPDDLKQLDAIEVQLGQGAYGNATPSTKKASEIDEHLRKTWRLEEGQDAVFSSRLKGVNSPQDVIQLLNQLKQDYDVPIGIKIAANHHIEKELAVIIQSDVDYIVIDGAEGGTAVASSLLQDHVGLPTIYGLSRTIRYLEEQGVRDKYQVIVAGGMKDPGVFLKAIALGADAVYIGTIALMALAQSQVEKTLPFSPPPQLLLHTGKMIDKLDIEEGAKHLANFLNSSIEDMKLAVIGLGKTAFSQLSRNDLVSVNKDLANALNIGYSGEPNP